MALISVAFALAGGLYASVRRVYLSAEVNTAQKADISRFKQVFSAAFYSYDSEDFTYSVSENDFVIKHNSEGEPEAYLFGCSASESGLSAEIASNYGTDGIILTSTLERTELFKSLTGAEFSEQGGLFTVKLSYGDGKSFTFALARRTQGD